MTAPNLRETPTLSEIYLKTQEKFGVHPCLWQLKVAHALLKGDWDVMCIAGTGMGKTLSFWILLLFCINSIQLVITPLNLLGKQNVLSLAIKALKYCAIIVSPEQIMKSHSNFEKLFKDSLFTSHLVGITIDEAHCIMDWGEFCPECQPLIQMRSI
ncbi:hypothetical protein BDR03DRAFT_860155 [Suillus americanus]|nr:hypothetical protein BDR03DRAFT_860155 [Suillus americanus]